MTTVPTRGTELEIGAVPASAQSAAPVEAAGPARVQLEGDLVLVDRGTAASSPTDLADQWGVQSFPASDPPPNW